MVRAWSMRLDRDLRGGGADGGLVISVPSEWGANGVR